MPVTTVQRGGKSAAREQDSTPQHQISMAELETCDEQNVHQGMGDDRNGPASTREQWKWTPVSYGQLGKSSARDTIRRKDAVTAQPRLQHDGQQQHADPRRDTCSAATALPLLPQHYRCCPATLPTHAAHGCHSHAISDLPRPRALLAQSIAKDSCSKTPLAASWIRRA